MFRVLRSANLDSTNLCAGLMLMATCGGHGPVTHPLASPAVDLVAALPPHEIIGAAPKQEPQIMH